MVADQAGHAYIAAGQHWVSMLGTMGLGECVRSEALLQLCPHVFLVVRSRASRAGTQKGCTSVAGVREEVGKKEPFGIKPPAVYYTIIMVAVLVRLAITHGQDARPARAARRRGLAARLVPVFGALSER